jgi:hypothetical protein
MGQTEIYVLVHDIETDYSLPLTNINIPVYDEYYEISYGDSGANCPHSETSGFLCVNVQGGTPPYNVLLSNGNSVETWDCSITCVKILKN